MNEFDPKKIKQAMADLDKAGANVMGSIIKERQFIKALNDNAEIERRIKKAYDKMHTGKGVPVVDNDGFVVSKVDVWKDLGPAGNHAVSYNLRNRNNMHYRHSFWAEIFRAIIKGIKKLWKQKS